MKLGDWITFLLVGLGAPLAIRFMTGHLSSGAATRCMVIGAMVVIVAAIRETPKQGDPA